MNFSEKCEKIALELSDYNYILDFLKNNISEEYLDKYLNTDWTKVDNDVFGELIDCCNFDDEEGFIETLDNL